MPATDKAPTTPADALELEIFRYATSSVVDELELNLTRTAYSELIYEYKDYSVGVLTHDFKLLTQSEGSIPLFVADLGPQVMDAVGVIGEQNLEDGDIFVSNYAPANGQHLNNVTCAAPIFQEGGIVAYVAIRAHWTDIGGLAPTSTSWDATDIFQEGVQYRGLRVVRAGKLVPEVMATFQANSRMPHYIYGDVTAQISACRLARERWGSRVAGKWSVAEQAQLVRLQAEQSAALTRSAIAALPDGEYEADCLMDDSGKAGTDPLPLKVRLRVEGDKFVVDYSQLPPQVRTPINTGAGGGATSIARCAFKMLFAPERPADEWLFDPLTVEIPDGTLLSAVGDAPMGFWNTTTPTMVDLILKAVGSRAPEFVPAGHHGSLGMLSWAGQDANGRTWVLPESGSGGFGGHSQGEGYGPLRTLCHGDNRGFPAELIEERFPLRVLSFELWRESAGEGEFRGGYGTERVTQALADLTLSTSLDRTLQPPWGMAGGTDAVPGSIQVQVPGEETWTSLTKVTGYPLPAGSLVRQRHAGGGGWGAKTAENVDPQGEGKK